MCANVKAMQNFLKHLPVPVHHVVDSSQEATIQILMLKTHIPGKRAAWFTRDPFNPIWDLSWEWRDPTSTGGIPPRNKGGIYRIRP